MVGDSRHTFHRMENCCALSLSLNKTKESEEPQPQLLERKPSLREETLQSHRARILLNIQRKMFKYHPIFLAKMENPQFIELTCIIF